MDPHINREDQPRAESAPEREAERDAPVGEIHTQPLKLPSAVINELTREDSCWKAYLDALPDLLRRGVKSIQIAGGAVVAEAFGSDPEELRSDMEKRHGQGCFRHLPYPRLATEVDARDLTRFHYYYHPDQELPD